MNKLSKIALLCSEDNPLTVAFERVGIQVSSFTNSDDIIHFKPDCVIITSPQHAKLTPYPTYGLINLPREDYLELPRFLRNILTYDGYLTHSPELERMLKDILFGARKLGSSIYKMDLFSADKYIPGFIQFHEKTLIDKGYIPN